MPEPLKDLKLNWPGRPKRSEHPTLGRRQRWRSAGDLYRIDRFAGGSGQFVATYLGLAVGEPLGATRKLAGAKRLCDRHARQRRLAEIHQRDRRRKSA